jgi:hypothetical protein
MLHEEELSDLYKSVGVVKKCMGKAVPLQA